MAEANLGYSLLCDDVRLEVGNKLSLMGVFQNVFLPGFPSTVVKFAVVNHWEGEGDFETQVRVLDPLRKETVISTPGSFSIAAHGHADNITFFTNVTFTQAGMHTVQVYLSGKVVSESPLFVHQVQDAGPVH